MTKTALILGVTGQDGSYLAEILLSKGYVVHGLIRRSSTINRERISHLHDNPKIYGKKIFFHYGDIADQTSLRNIIFNIRPDEIYNLAAQSHVKISFEIPDYTANVTGLAVLNLLEIIKQYQDLTRRKVRFYQASSSEMFGASPAPQNEKTPFLPQSPYGCAKVFAYYATRLYREAYGIFAVNGILFNHESPRRGENFVTRKITIGVARIKAGLDKKLYLGNLDAQRDWGYSPEYMEAAWLMLQQPEPDHFVIGTGEVHTVRDFRKVAFSEAGLGDYKKYVRVDKRYCRPAEANVLRADISKAKKILGWKPRTKFANLVKIMVKADLEKNN